MYVEDDIIAFQRRLIINNTHKNFKKVQSVMFTKVNFMTFTCLKWCFTSLCVQ
jgi:hypothetical protein